MPGPGGLGSVTPPPSTDMSPASTTMPGLVISLSPPPLTSAVMRSSGCVITASVKSSVTPPPLTLTSSSFGTTQRPSRRTPITFMLRQDLAWLLQAHRGAAAPAEPTPGPGRDVLDALRTHGALFHADLQAKIRN